MYKSKIHEPVVTEKFWLHDWPSHFLNAGSQRLKGGFIVVDEAKGSQGNEFLSFCKDKKGV